MAKRYDICDLGDLLLQLSDKEAGTLLKAIVRYRNGKPLPEVPYPIRATLAGEVAKIDAAEQHRRLVSDKRKAAVSKRWDTNVYNCIQMNTNVFSRPPLSTPITNPPIEISKDIINSPPKGGRTFLKPSIEEVRQYCESRKNNVNASNFWDFYESKGWMVGKNKMKDWKAAVRTWERRSQSNTAAALSEEAKKYGGAF